MKYEHLKLRIIEDEYKYVLLDTQVELEALLKVVPRGPMALFRSVDEISAIVSEQTEVRALKTEGGWICLRIVGEMPFGTVQGLIAEISTALAKNGLGICVVSTFLTDWFFVKSKNREIALEVLTEIGWAFV